MRQHIWERAGKLDWGFIIRAIYVASTILLAVLTLLVCLDSPVQRHFKNIGKTDVWFGEDWHYTAQSGKALEGQLVGAKSRHYLEVCMDGGHASIAKTLDFTPSQDEYLCFRARAQDAAVYVNGSVWYEHHFSEQYRAYSRRMYLLHHVPAWGLKEGDEITIELEGESGEGTVTLQYLAIGDRYALTSYIMKRSTNSLVICAGALVLMLLSFLTIHSSHMGGNPRDIKALRWLICFLALSALYLGTDSGCLEIFTERTSIVSWFNNLSMILLPIPAIFFMKYALFPGHLRYDVLAFTNFVIVAAAVISYVSFAVSISDFYIFIHLVIAAVIVVCIMSFVHEKTTMQPEFLAGSVVLALTTLASIAAYWYDLIYPCSIVFGYGLLVFGACMLAGIVRTRYELDSMRDEADHAFLQRDKIAAQEANEQKSRFLSHMSHEIRTPLNAILGMNELILRDAQDPDTKKQAAAIQSAGQTLLALINDVLDYSKIETGKMDIVPSQYSLCSMLNDVVLMIQKKAEDKGLAFRIDVDPSLPDLLYGDEIRIKQVLINLMSNAVKYTKEGWIGLSVGQKSVSGYLDEQDILLDVRVSDSGMGIRKEEMPDLFAEFERLDQKKNKSIEGTGLGLSIASRLISLMKGSISVESEYGKGSTFIVTLPQTVVSASPIGDHKKRFEVLSNAQSTEVPELMAFPGRHIFVVDDNELNLEVIASILEMFEVDVRRASSGREAIEHLDRERCDLILTDDMMPDITGTDLMRYLHAHEESANHSTPIVVLTANAVFGVREEYLDKGFDEYMSKPIDAEVLQKIMQKFLA